MAQIQQADPGARRLTLVCLAFAAGFGSVGWMLLDRYRQSLVSWFLANEPDAQVTVIVIALVLLLAPLLLMAGWVWRYGLRVLRGSRHPPEGVKVIRDTPVIHGAGARLHARLYQALATMFVVTALYVLWFSWTLWRVQ